MSAVQDNSENRIVTVSFTARDPEREFAIEFGNDRDRRFRLSAGPHWNRNVWTKRYSWPCEARRVAQEAVIRASG
jgi:hypothetical protein